MAQQYGLGNFLYEIEVSDGKANFSFHDPEDPSNTAQVAVAKADFPEGATADSRQVADLAYDQCQKVLNEKRDARIKKQAADDLATKQKEDARIREEAAEILANGQDVTVEPAKIEKNSDGSETRVYNTAEPTTDNSDNKKK